jgi:hypothetical protein
MNPLSAVVNLVASPPEEQEDRAQHGKLLQDAGADGKPRRFSYAVASIPISILPSEWANR